MTAVKTSICAQSEAVILPFAPTVYNTATNVQDAIVLASLSGGTSGSDWTISVIDTGLTAVTGTLYVISGASGNVPITLPAAPLLGDKVAVYMEDFSSTQIATVDAGSGKTIGAIGSGAQTHQLGGQGVFAVYRYIGVNVWMVEQPIVTRQIRYRTSNLTLSKIFDNSIVYVNHVAARTVTVPLNATTPLPVGYQTEIVRWDTGAVTLVADVGVTITATSPLALPDTYSRGVLTKIDTDTWTWILFGVADNHRVDTLEFVIEGNATADGGYGAISAGLKGFLESPFAGTITAATLMADQVGSIVVDIWKDTFANYPPTVADSITAGSKPTLAAQAASRDVSVNGWVTSIAAGDILAVNVDSAATVRRVTLSLTVKKS
jgi:hypothetical protein